MQAQARVQTCAQTHILPAVICQHLQRQGGAVGLDYGSISQAYPAYPANQIHSIKLLTLIMTIILILITVTAVLPTVHMPPL